MNSVMFHCMFMFMCFAHLEGAEVGTWITCTVQLLGRSVATDTVLRLNCYCSNVSAFSVNKSASAFCVLKAGIALVSAVRGMKLNCEYTSI